MHLEITEKHYPDHMASRTYTAILLALREGPMTFSEIAVHTKRLGADVPGRLLRDQLSMLLRERLIEIRPRGPHTKEFVLA